MFSLGAPADSLSAPIKLRTYLKPKISFNTISIYIKNLFRLNWKNLGSYTRVFTVIEKVRLTVKWFLYKSICFPLSPIPFSFFLRFNTKRIKLW